MLYFLISGVFEANSGCNHQIKSGRILIDRKVSQKLRILFNVLSGSHFGKLSVSYTGIAEVEAGGEVYPERVKRAEGTPVRLTS